MKKNKSQADIIADTANKPKWPLWPFPPLESIVRGAWPFPTGPKPSGVNTDEDQERKYIDQTWNNEGGQLAEPFNGIEGKDLPPITGSFAHQNIGLVDIGSGTGSNYVFVDEKSL